MTIRHFSCWFSKLFSQTKTKQPVGLRFTHPTELTGFPLAEHKENQEKITKIIGKRMIVISFSNSLIIQPNKTKEIKIVTVFWKSDLN